MIPPISDGSPFIFDAEGFLRHPGSVVGVYPWGWGFLYLLRCDNYVKIGITDDVAKRISTLQCGNPRPIRPGRKWEFEDRNYATLAERTAHQVFASARVSGEWFEVDFKVAAPIVREIVHATKRLRSIHRDLPQGRRFRITGETNA